MKNKVTLAIETAVGNGSLSLFENDKMLDEWSGENKIARSDRFLPILDEFLNKNNVDKKDLNLIAVSRGPGSFTGARIGLATAVAVKNGLGVKCLGISVLRAIAVSSIRTVQDDVITAILNDRNQIISEKFAAGSKNLPENLRELSKYTDVSRELSGTGANLLTIDDFVRGIKSIAVNTRVLLDRSLFDLLNKNYGIENLKTFSEKADFENIGDNLSSYIGSAAIEDYASDNLSIVYLNADKINAL